MLGVKVCQRDVLNRVAGKRVSKITRRDGKTMRAEPLTLPLLFSSTSDLLHDVQMFVWADATTYYLRFVHQKYTCILFRGLRNPFYKLRSPDHTSKLIWTSSTQYCLLMQHVWAG